MERISRTAPVTTAVQVDALVVRARRCRCCAIGCRTWIARSSTGSTDIDVQRAPIAAPGCATTESAHSPGTAEAVSCPSGRSRPRASAAARNASKGGPAAAGGKLPAIPHARSTAIGLDPASGRHAFVDVRITEGIVHADCRRHEHAAQLECVESGRCVDGDVGEEAVLGRRRRNRRRRMPDSRAGSYQLPAKSAYSPEP